MKYNVITGLYLELTTKCNAICPMCNRNYKGKIRKNIKYHQASFVACFLY